MFTEIIKAGSGNSFIDTSTPFKPLSTKVFINNIELPSSSYMEIESTSINILSLINDNSVIAIKYEPLETLPVISHSSNAVSYFKTFSSEEKLKINQRYSLSLKVKGKSISHDFISKCTPLYSSIKKSKEDIGSLIDSIKEESIYYFVHMNSKELDEKIEENDIDVTEGIPLNLKNWVRYKTDLDIVNGIYLSLCSKDDLSSKRIGPITIESRYKLPEVKNMLLRFKEQFMYYDNLLGGGSSISVSSSFIKGGTSYPYPINTRNSF